MDSSKIVEIFRATIDPTLRKEAEEHLSQIHKIVGFTPTLLQIVMQNEVEMPVRQAGVIFFKNLVTHNWQEGEIEPGQPAEFTIPEQDKAMIRDSIVEAVVLAPELIRVHLGLCVNKIVKHDFPTRWTTLVGKVTLYLQTPDTSTWMGALLSLYQLVKHFEFTAPEERTPLSEPMRLLLPMIHQRCVQLLQDSSEASVSLQKQILKIYYALFQYNLPLELVTQEVFGQWMEVIRAVLERPVPETQVDEDERAELIWWKCKKWALRIITKVFERYGSPGSVAKEYKQFADYYLKTFTGGVIEVLLRILDQYRHKVYVAPRVLQLSLLYLDHAIIVAFSWRLLKVHMSGIMKEILFPLMCYTDRDHELWTTDPLQYIRIKFDVLEDFLSPVTAAQTLLHTACRKRKDMLQSTMQFAMTLLTNPASDPRLVDGALNMIGTLADVLLKKQVYKDQMEVMLVTYVYPLYQSEHAFMRARACWMIHNLCEVEFKVESNLIQALAHVQKCLLNETELPVKVEAAIALQMLITHQEKAQDLVEPNINQIVLELLKLIRETESDDLTDVLQRMVCLYSEKLTGIAVEMTQHLAVTFSQVVESEECAEEKTMVAQGLLNTLETMLTVMEKQQPILTQLEPIVLTVIGQVLSRGVHEYYEETFSLVYALTCNTVSQDMWKALEMMCQVFHNKDGLDYFTDMMPALHNFITVDTPAFVSNRNHLLAMFNIAKTVLTEDAGEDAECHAAKLLEVIILQCRGQIDECIPSFVQLMMERLAREVMTSELRTMCLQVVICALYYNPQLLIQTLETISLPNVSDSTLTHFVKLWVHDTDCFLGLHDRKVCVLGLCTLLSMANVRPVITDCAPLLVPSLITLFDGLKRAYAHKAQCDDEDSDEEESEDEDVDDEVLGSDEDDMDGKAADYLQRLQKKLITQTPFPITATIQDDVESEDDDSDDDEEDDGIEETALESYTTSLDDGPVDEYWAFKEVLMNLESGDPAWYTALTAHLTPEQTKSLKEVMTLADQRKAAAESKKIEENGGYQFDATTVPTTFNFGDAMS